jgi:lipid-A-disaccharide synthase
VQSSKLRIGIISAEKSGDYLAASFIESLKSSGRDFELFGIGGKELDKFNISRPQYFDREIFNVMGIIDPLKNLRQILRARKQILDFLISKNINIFIGVDSPDLNSFFHKKLKKINSTINFQIVSPSVWAWRSGRVKQLRKFVDTTFCLFKFEHEYLKKNNVNSFHVGHPFQDIEKVEDISSIKNRHGIKNDSECLTFLVGSRRSEISSMLPIYKKVIKKIYEGDKSYSFLFPVVNQDHKNIIQAELSELEPPIFVQIGKMKEFLSLSTFTISTSGTASLEAACYGNIPIICYKTSLINYLILKPLMQTNLIGLPNLILGKNVFPELLQNQCTPHEIFDAFMSARENKDQLALRVANVKDLIKGNGMTGGARYLLERVNSASRSR